MVPSDRHEENIKYNKQKNRLRNNCNNTDFTPFYFTLDSFNALKVLLIKIVLLNAAIDILM
jgi:hypothetical protein